MSTVRDTAREFEELLEENNGVRNARTHAHNTVHAFSITLLLACVWICFL
jgi:hypothetical protein